MVRSWRNRASGIDAYESGTQGSRQNDGWHILVTDRAEEPINGQGADGCRSSVGRCRIRSAMHHGGRDFDTRPETVDEKAAGKEFKPRQ